MAKQTTYKGRYIDGLYTVPELHLDWKDILSEKHKLWDNYKNVLLLFYYSTNHEGSCADVAEEFNKNALSLNAKMMNFCKQVQALVGDFAVVTEDNRIQYWPIAFDGYTDKKGHFVWRVKSDLVEAIRERQLETSSIKEKFLQHFPLQSLRQMSLEQYTNLNRTDSFCYWLESKTWALGSIWGGSSLKFGIYQYDNNPSEREKTNRDDKYCWFSKYNCSTSQEAFELVRSRVATIAEYAAAGNLKGIESIDFGDVVKWKIASLYSDNKVIHLYADEYLQAAARDLGFAGNFKSRAEMYEFISSKFDSSKETFFDFYMRIGLHYFGEVETGKTYWLAGFNYGKNDSQIKRFFQDGIWEGKFDETKSFDKKQLELAKTITAGDVIILKSSATKGENHSTPFLRVQAVGLVKDNITLSNSGDIFVCRCEVDYINKENKDFDGPEYGAFRKTIHKATNKVKDLITYVDSLLPTDTKSITNMEQEQEQTNKYQKYINLLKEAKNLVLTGAPGTGKTYMAKAIAKAMNAELKFVQFHPSYDYTDFVEGLRPVKADEGQMGFQRVDGEFKKFCKQAIKNLEDSRKSQEELTEEKTLEDKYNELVGKIENGEINEFNLKTGKKMEVVKVSDFNNIILRTPGTSSDRTYTVSFDRIAKLAKAYPTAKSVKAISNINEATRTVIGGCNASAYWAVLNAVYGQEVSGETKVTAEVRRKDFVFIIDEINRGEASKIFGELFYAIDPGYRGQSDTLVQTQYQNLVSDNDEFAKGFYVPENVYILGTMNDIDRSVESMDFAMRRRFTWKEITPSDTQDMLNKLPCADEAKETMKRLNLKIAATDGLGPAFMIGPSYFLKLGENGGDFGKLWEMNIEPLLREYLRGFRKAAELILDYKKAYFNEAKQEADSSPVADED